MSLLIFLAIGALAGFLAARLMGQASKGLLRNIILGVVGSFVGGFVFDLVGISFGGLLGSIVTATAGAALVIFVASKVLK